MAGIAATRRTPVGKFGLTTLEDDDWDMIMKTNLDGVKNCLRAQLQAIKGPGSIVNAASTAGQYGPPNCSPYALRSPITCALSRTDLNVSYVVSKWGVIGLTKTAAKECGKQGVRVNAVAPYVSLGLYCGKAKSV
jgi:NAD(P)-dependent dehydrogenase (short-subunit alcohol dehydrogenase family)